MILYTEKQLLIAYTRYVRGLKQGNLRIAEPTIEEFRTIYETEHENKLWDEMNYD
tara:strand:- start:392 stop:556 length:165 start_codon:yes stop_codon:yes gene_type:complete